MKYLFGLMAILTILSGCSGTSTDSNTVDKPSVAPASITDESNVNEDNFDLNSYKNSVSELCDEIEHTSIALGNMGKWEKSFMETLGRPSDDMVERAYSWLDENSDYTRDGIESSYDKILNSFSEIATNTKGDDADTIFKEVSSLNASFVALYSTVTTPPVSISEFGDELSEYFSAVASGLENVSSLIQ